MERASGDDDPRRPALVRDLGRPDAYPERPAEVRTVQTHISWVFLAGDRVYKVKKPVRFEFLDYSTLAKRLACCRDEVRLNARLAPGIYEGVVAVVRAPGGHRIDPVAGTGADVVEYAVAMRRLPAAEMLDVRLREGTAGAAEVRALARRLAAFHEAAGTGLAARYGTPEAVLGTVTSDLAEMRSYTGEALTPEEFGSIDAFYRDFAARERARFARRLAEGRVREGHGDLRAEHVCLLDPVVIFDCVEFSERLRTADVASEIAFLAMDLDFLGAPRLAAGLLECYAEAAADPDVLVLYPFYGCYRACVRGKVEMLKAAEPEVPEADRRDAVRRARRYFRLALRLAFGGVAPALIVVCGPAGSGKTTAARLLGADTGFPVHRSDVVRKRLAGLGTTERAAAGVEEGIYSASFSERTYRRLLADAEDTLGAGVGAIIDATFVKAAHRRPFASLAERKGVPILFVECRAAEDEVLRRLDARRGDPAEASDAGREIYLRQRDAWEPLDEIPPSRRLTVDTGAGLASLPDRVRQALR